MILISMTWPPLICCFPDSLPDFLSGLSEPPSDCCWSICTDRTQEKISTKKGNLFCEVSFCLLHVLSLSAGRKRTKYTRWLLVLFINRTDKNVHEWSNDQTAFHGKTKTKPVFFNNKCLKQSKVVIKSKWAKCLSYYQICGRATKHSIHKHVANADCKILSQNTTEY